MTAIENVVGRDDLADRSIILTLEAIPDDRRRPEKSFGMRLKPTAHIYWAQCSTLSPTACAPYRARSSTRIRVWPTSCDG
jgi:hypothetical protein